MDITEIEKIGVIIHSAVFRNDEHKNILREMFFGTELDDEDLSLAAGGTDDNVNKSLSRRQGTVLCLPYLKRID